MILRFAWAAYPFTDYALQSNSNDTLVAALLVWALVLFAPPVWRGVLLGARRGHQVRAAAARAAVRGRPDGPRARAEGPRRGSCRGSAVAGFSSPSLAIGLMLRSPRSTRA